MNIRFPHLLSLSLTLTALISACGSSNPSGAKATLTSSSQPTVEGIVRGKGDEEGSLTVSNSRGEVIFSQVSGVVWFEHSDDFVILQLKSDQPDHDVWHILNAEGKPLIAPIELSRNQRPKARASARIAAIEYYDEGVDGSHRVFAVNSEGKQLVSPEVNLQPTTALQISDQILSINSGDHIWAINSQGQELISKGEYPKALVRLSSRAIAVRFEEARVTRVLAMHASGRFLVLPDQAFPKAEIALTDDLLTISSSGSEDPVQFPIP